MAETHHEGEHHGPTLMMYAYVSLALAVCTISSFVFNSMAKAGTINTVTSFLLILGVAFIKATLVIMIFMHFKWDWKLLYFLVLPALVMGLMMVVVLLPDIFVGPSHDAREWFEMAKEMK